MATKLVAPSSAKPSPASIPHVYRHSQAPRYSSTAPTIWGLSLLTSCPASSEDMAASILQCNCGRARRVWNKLSREKDDWFYQSVAQENRCEYIANLSLFVCLFQLGRSNATRPCGVRQGWVALLILFSGLSRRISRLPSFPSSCHYTGLLLTWRPPPSFPSTYQDWSAPNLGGKRYTSNQLASGGKAGYARRCFINS